MFSFLKREKIKEEKVFFKNNYEILIKLLNKRGEMFSYKTLQNSYDLTHEEILVFIDFVKKEEIVKEIKLQECQECFFLEEGTNTELNCGRCGEITEDPDVYSYYELI